MPEPTIAELQAMIADLQKENTKLAGDKQFLLEDNQGTKEVLKQLEEDLATTIKSYAEERLALQRTVGQMVFGVHDVPGHLQDYSRVGDFLIRTGVIPQDTKVGMMHTALMTAEISKMRAAGEITSVPVAEAKAPGLAETSVASEAAASPVSAPVPPPSPAPPAPPAPAPMTPSTGPNSGPTVKTINPPLGGWSAQPKLG